MKIIKSFGGDPINNIAMEEVLSDYSIELEEEVIRIWIQDKTLVIGYGQKPSDEINLELADKLEIPIVRRQSGGGTVYHDLGNINFSLYIPRRIIDISKIYGIGSKYIIHTLKKLSLNPYIENRNDIVIEGYKVSGSSIWIRRDATVYHATLLVEADIDLMKKLLNPPLQLVREGRVTPAKYRPTNLTRFIKVSLEEAIETLEESIEDLSGDIELIKIDSSLYKRLNKIVRKYLNGKWNIKRGYKEEIPYNLLK